MGSKDSQNKGHKIESWVSTDKNGQLRSTDEARILAEKARAKYTSKDARDKLFKEVFGSFANKDSYTVGKGESFKVDTSDSGKGLLETLSKRSPVLNATFKSFPDTRLVAYQNLFFKFEEQDADANVLPMGSMVSLKEGVVTVEYPNGGKKVSALLFPWEEPKSPAASAATAATIAPAPTPISTPPPAPVEVKIEKIEPVEVKIETKLEMNFEEDWAENGILAKSIRSEYPQLKITDKSKDLTIGFDRPTGSKKVEISNSITGEAYIVEITPKKDAVNYQDSAKLHFSVTKLIDGRLGIRDDKKKFTFDEAPQSVIGALEACARYTSEIRDNHFSLDSHIRMSTSVGGDEISKMNPNQKLTYIRSFLTDAKRKYERISNDPVLGKKEKVYLESVRGEVTFLKAAYEDLPKKSDDVDAIFSYFDSKLSN